MTTIDAHKQLLEEHRHLQERYQVLQRLLHLFGAPEDFELVFDGVLDVTLHAFDAAAGTFYGFDAEEEELYFASVRGPKADEVLALDLTIKPGQGLAGACFQERRVIAVSDAHKDPRFSKEISEAVGYEVHSVLCTPLVNEGECYGVLQLLNKQRGSAFTSEEVSFAKQLGQSVGGLLRLGLELRELQLHAGHAEEANS